MPETPRQRDDPSASTASLAVVEDPRFRDHEAPPGHPECAERLDAVHSALAGARSHWTPFPARPASDEELLRVHTREHVDLVNEAARRAPARIDADTFVSPRSFEVASLAVGSAVELTCAVASGAFSSGIAALRPPGHHAEASGPMGFCLFNNVALAARAVQARHGVDRILILDWDLHHGNGTQHFFEEDPSILYASTHQYPFYPGTGAVSEVGIGRGEGATLNIPLTAGAGDPEHVGALQRLVVPAARSFRPELVLVSAGFDSHRDDPLGSMQVSRDGFLDMTRIVRALADELCGGRLVFLLEGGYAPSGLGDGTEALLQGLLEEPHLPDLVEAPAGSALRAVVERVTHAHATWFPTLGAP